MAPASSDLSEFVIEDERAFCGLDARLRYSEVQVGDCGRLRGRLPVVSCAINAFSGEVRSALGLDDLSGRIAIIGGGLSQFRAAIWTCDQDAAARSERITTMVRQAIQEAYGRGETPMSAFIPDSDVNACIAAGLNPVSCRPRQPWFTLDLHGAASLAEFLEVQPRKSRQTWRRDYRDAEGIGLSYDVSELDDESIKDATPLVAEVSRRNGLTQPEAFVQLRLKGFLRRPGDHFFLRVKRSETIVAYTACRIWRFYLEAHTVGIWPETDERRSTYHFAAYYAPLAQALASGIRLVGYGIGHDEPKEYRGCGAVKMWRVDY